MFGSLWRFLVYRVLGGRVLLGITVLAWIYRRLTGRRATISSAPERPVVVSTDSVPSEDGLTAGRTGR